MIPEYFISPSGLNTNPGTKDAPVQTYAAAEAKVPSGSAAKFFFDAGGFHQPIYLKRSGLPDQPNVFDVYNGDYAKFHYDSTATAVYVKGIKNVVFQNFSIRPVQRKDGFLIHNCENITVRDCLIDSASYGLDLGREDMPSKNITLERLIIRNCWNVHGKKSQGMYATGIDGLKILNCIFSRNGWSNQSTNAILVQQNHNIYLSEKNKNVEVRDCFIGEGCSHGIQLRCGGVVSGNLFFFNPIHAFGQNDEAVFENNVLEGSRPMGHGTATITDVWRGWGYDAEAAKNTVVNNLFINGGLQTGDSRAIEVGRIVRSTNPDGGTIIKGNRVYNWKNAAYRNNSGRQVIEEGNLWEYQPTTISHIPDLHDAEHKNWPDIPAIRTQLMKDYEKLDVKEVAKEKIKTLQDEASKEIQSVQNKMQNELQTVQKNLDAKLQGLLDTLNS